MLMKLFILFFTVIFLQLQANAQSVSIKGKVKDREGVPIPSATITFLNGSSNSGTTTDANGNFEIKVRDSIKTQLQFSSVGFESKKLKLKGKTYIEITLELSKTSLNEVVVVGYSTRITKKSMSYSTTTISGDQLNNQLYGTIAGVQVSNGNNSNIILRGAASINSNAVDEDSNLPPGDFDSTLSEEHGEGYNKIIENKFQRTNTVPISTFSIDVDGASYSNLRRMIKDGKLPPADAIRVEEMVNYFKYNYPKPSDTLPFSITMEMSDCPWNNKNKLMMVALHAKEIATENLPAANLVFLVDVSGSMSSNDKLPLVKASLKLLVSQLRPIDKVSLVV
jgi:Ca-activated chloride channel homolog